MGRRQRITACVLVFVVSCLAAALVRDLEVREGAPHGSLVLTVGLAPAVFVTLFVSGTLLLAQLMGYKRRRAWVTTVLLLAFLTLQVMTWQRASNVEHAMAEPQIVGDPDNPNPLPPSSPAAVDGYAIVMYTLGFMCAGSAILTLRRLIRWHMPSPGSGKHHRHHHAAVAVDAPAVDDTTPPDDLVPVREPAAPRPPVDPAMLDRSPGPSAAEPKVAPPEDEPETPRKRSRRLFE
jgi:hypothetical protein